MSQMSPVMLMWCTMQCQTWLVIFIFACHHLRYGMHARESCGSIKYIKWILNFHRRTTFTNRSCMAAYNASSSVCRYYLLGRHSVWNGKWKTIWVAQTRLMMQRDFKKRYISLLGNFLFRTEVSGKRSLAEKCVAPKMNDVLCKSAYFTCKSILFDHTIGSICFPSFAMANRTRTYTYTYRRTVCTAPECRYYFIIHAMNERKSLSGTAMHNVLLSYRIRANCSIQCGHNIFYVFVLSTNVKAIE